MPCPAVPGGVVAGVVGIDRALMPVSIDKGCAGAPFAMFWLPQSYDCPWPLIPITLEALVGGVGKV
jgi:hypothetical protein